MPVTLASGCLRRATPSRGGEGADGWRCAGSASSPGRAAGPQPGAEVVALCPRQPAEGEPALFGRAPSFPSARGRGAGRGCEVRAGEKAPLGRPGLRGRGCVAAPRRGQRPPAPGGAGP